MSDPQILNNGSCGFENIDCSAGDMVPSALNCRGIEADIGGIVKVQIKCPIKGLYDLVISLNDATWKGVQGIQKVYRYYTGTTGATTTIYKTDGTTTAGVRLIF
jgi:hypothetical protein